MALVAKGGRCISKKCLALVNRLKQDQPMNTKKHLLHPCRRRTLLDELCPELPLWACPHGKRTEAGKVIDFGAQQIKLNARSDRDVARHANHFDNHWLMTVGSTVTVKARGWLSARATISLTGRRHSPNRHRKRFASGGRFPPLRSSPRRTALSGESSSSPENEIMNPLIPLKAIVLAFVLLVSANLADAQFLARPKPLPPRKDASALKSSPAARTRRGNC